MQADNILLKDPADVSIETDLTIMQLYPHAGKPFHYLMAFVTLFILTPATYLVFPVMVALKLILYTPLYLLIISFPGEAARGKIWNLKNRVSLPVQYLVYKLYYVHIGLWYSCFGGYDDYWYGLDVSKYRDHDDYLSSYRDSRVRWQFKKKLRIYNSYGITEKIVPDHAVFYKILFSYRYFRLVCGSNFRKNSGIEMLFGQFLVVRDYFLLLFLPVRVHVYEKEGRAAGLATYLKKGNTVIMCQHIISDDFVRSGIFYKQMDTCIDYAFKEPGVRYLSCSITSRQAKQTSGCYPINYLLTDEYRLIPFGRLNIR